MSISTTLRPVRVYTLRQETEDADYAMAVAHESGLFHQFIAGVNFALAVIELPDGSVITPRADMIQFLDTTPQEVPRHA